MQVALLAARPFSAPLSEYDGWPKPLLPAGGRKVIDHLLERLCSDPRLSMIHICTDRSGYQMFREWLRGCDYTGKVALFRCGGECRSELEALSELVRSRGAGEDLLVVSGSHFLDIPFGPLVDYAEGLDGDVVAVSEIPENGGRCARVVFTSGGRVIDLGPGREEVDALSLFPVVRFSPASLMYVDRYLRDGGDAECIGSLLEHTYRVRPLYAFGIDGACYPLSESGCLKKISSLFEKNRRA